MPPPNDYTGQVFHQLTAIQFTGLYSKTSGGNKKRLWLFQCDCGQETIKQIERVVKGHSKSCGCRKGKYTGIDAIAYQVYSECYNDGDLLFEDFLLLSAQDCHWCGDPPSNHRKSRAKEGLFFHYNGLDRIDHYKPHNKDNVNPSCFPCNERRGRTSITDWLDWHAKVAIKHNLVNREV